MGTDQAGRLSLSGRLPVLTPGILILTFFFLGCARVAKPVADRPGPNILLIAADDLGYSDLGSYGGEIRTPHLDSLASRGIRFSRFHTAPMCSPTRAMLLTGTDHHISGVGRQNLRTEVFGYEGRLTDRVVALPILLKEAGYRTMIAGKWHLGLAAASNPSAHGFDQSFVLLEGVGNHFNGLGVFKENGESHYTENGRSASFPAGSYDTDFYTEKLIEYIGHSSPDTLPFFAMATFTSPHWPLQVDSTYSNPYRGRYDAGYESLRRARIAAMQELGLIAADVPIPKPHPDVRPWDSLSATEKMISARKMEIYAGMVANLDYNIGRLLSHLKVIGAYENTLIIFLSDNGAAGEDYYNDETIREYLHPRYDNSYENMGQATSLVSYGASWAEAGTGAFRYFKEYPTNGGILSPLIVAGAGITRGNTIYPGVVTVMDIAPTLYEAAGVNYPDTRKGSALYPLEGTSLMGYVGGRHSEVHGENYGFGLEHAGYTCYRKGPWKLVNWERPFSESDFGLFHSDTDPGETNDLKCAHPEKYEELLEAWRTFAREKRLQLPR